MNNVFRSEPKTPLNFLGFFKEPYERVFKSQMGNRILRGSFWSTIGLFFSKGLELITFIFVARMLTKARFGELGIIQSTISMFRIFAWIWLGTTVTKFVAEFREKDPEKTSRIIGFSHLVGTVLGLLFASLLFVLSPWLSERVLAAPQLADPLRISALMLFFGSLVGVQNGILAGFENFKLSAMVNLVSGVLNLPILLISVYFFGLKGAVWGLAALAIINWLLNHRALKKIEKTQGLKPTLKNCLQEWKPIFHFSLPTFLSGILVNPVNWVCSTLLANQINGYSELGVFNAANQWRNAILFLPIALGTSILPILSNLKGTNQWDRYKKVLIFSILISLSISLAIALPVILSSQFIMGFYGADFRSHHTVIIFLALSAVITAITATVGNSIASMNKMWWGFSLNVLWAIAVLIFTKLLIGKGALGLSLAYLYAYIIQFIMMGLYLYFTMHFHKQPLERASPTYSTFMTSFKKTPILMKVPSLQEYQNKKPYPERIEFGQRISRTFSKKSSPSFPLVSVITVVRNREKTIERTIQSVLNQTYKNIEYILVDGKSTDHTLDFIHKYEKEIAYCLSEPDQGISDAFNKGIAASTGELIALVHADDWYNEKSVERVVNASLSHPQCILHGNMKYWVNHEEAKAYIVTGNDKEILRKITVNHITMFVPRIIYEEIGLYDLDFTIAMDFEWLRRAKVLGKEFYYINDVITNMSSGGMSENWIKGYIECAKAKRKQGVGWFGAYYSLGRMVFLSAMSRNMQKIGLDPVVVLLKKYFSAVKRYRA